MARRSSARSALVRAGGLAAALALVLACAETPPAQEKWHLWLTDPPPGCRLGSSPTGLYPGDALRAARADAFAELRAWRERDRAPGPASEEEADVVLWDRPEAAGVLEGAHIVAIFSDRGGAKSGKRVYALACGRDVAARTAEAERTPEWLMNPFRGAGRICVPAVAGASVWAEDLRPAAIRDGQKALQEEIERELERQAAGPELRLPKQAPVGDPAERAREIAARATRLDPQWLDEEGRGPLALPGALYALLCVSP